MFVWELFLYGSYIFLWVLLIVLLIDRKYNKNWFGEETWEWLILSDFLFISTLSGVVIGISGLLYWWKYVLWFFNIQI